MHRLTLIGYRACGKSTIGRLVAARLAWPFIDADSEIEHRIGMPIAAFFKERGEPAFRDAETEVLASILAGDGPLVLATGGGAVLRPANREQLRARGGHVVYIEASAAVLQERLRHAHGGRPSLSGGNVADEVPGILAVRDPLYREVATTILPSHGGPGVMAERIAGLI